MSFLLFKTTLSLLSFSQRNHSKILYCGIELFLTTPFSIDFIHNRTSLDSSTCYYAEGCIPFWSSPLCLICLRVHSWPPTLGVIINAPAITQRYSIAGFKVIKQLPTLIQTLVIRPGLQEENADQGKN